MPYSHKYIKTKLTDLLHNSAHVKRGHLNGEITTSPGDITISNDIYSSLNANYNFRCFYANQLFDYFFSLMYYQTNANDQLM
jgi:hypothetical protein